MTERVRDVFSSVVAPLIGQAAWSARLGVGSMIKLDFGDRIQWPPPPASFNSKRKSAPSTEWGEWRLSVKMAAWRIESRDELLAANEDRDETRMAAAVASLAGRALVRASITSKALDAVFCFAGGRFLRVFPCSSDDEAWTLFYPEKMVFVAGPGCRGLLRRADAPRSNIVATLGPPPRQPRASR